MIDEGYEEGRAIPIATSKAKEWAENASTDEIDDFLTHDDETERDADPSSGSGPELMNKAEHVIKHKKAGQSKPRAPNVCLKSRIQRKKRLNGQRKSRRIKALRSLFI